ncbi:hypothetical protein AVEN_17099-1 [Araneus ventricosus]|uniref:Uncharacterized protein n=1 Tax=Araneus ventricosus TaxID=182803 RepID=A0A4Y2U169_ARAVE|nr:hypothetical protein AVEN_17099-1 [Araneus ventricosus]
MGCHARPAHGVICCPQEANRGNSFSWRGPSPTLEARKEKVETQKGGKNSKGEQILGYLLIVNLVTSKENVAPRGFKTSKRGIKYECFAIRPLGMFRRFVYWIKKRQIRKIVSNFIRPQHFEYSYWSRDHFLDDEENQNFLKSN